MAGILQSMRRNLEEAQEAMMAEAVKEAQAIVSCVRWEAAVDLTTWFSRGEPTVIDAITFINQ
jgi:hypothetical protein